MISRLRLKLRLYMARRRAPESYDFMDSTPIPSDPPPVTRPKSLLELYEGIHVVSTIGGDMRIDGRPNGTIVTAILLDPPVCIMNTEEMYVSLHIKPTGSQIGNT